MKKILFYVGVLCLLVVLGLVIGPIIIEAHHIETNMNHIESLNPKVDSVISRQISQCVYEAGKKYYIPDEFILALIFVESSFNPLAVSKSGAIGLTQIMQKWHPEKVKEFTREELFHINNNINIGIKIFKEYYDSVNGNPQEALYKYFGSENDDYMLKVMSTFAKLVVNEN